MQAAALLISKILIVQNLWTILMPSQTLLGHGLDGGFWGALIPDFI